MMPNTNTNTQENTKVTPYSREWWAERKYLIDAFVDGRKIAYFDSGRGFPNEKLLQFSEEVHKYTIIPFEIPAPPEGKEWHLKDSLGTLTAELLEPHKGYRPLLKDEVVQMGDEYYLSGSDWEACHGGIKAHNCLILRTKRPLPVEPVELIKELTVEQIQKELGYKIKIVETKK
jgi:hypothetical protein